MNRSILNQSSQPRTGVLILMALAFLFLRGIGPEGAVAEEITFSAGSLIIPMDSVWQDDADQGIFEAYGLVAHLLDGGLIVYWAIDQEKTSVDGIDFTVTDLTESPVVRLCDYGGGLSDLPGVTTTIRYRGGPFVINADGAEEARAIIEGTSTPNWEAVDVHEAQVPFTADIYRALHGSLKDIYIMNDHEDVTRGGNAKICEAYLRLAGICTNFYEIITPNNIRDGYLNTENDATLWVPHWDGYKKNKFDDDHDGLPDVENIVQNMATFLDQGGSLLALCSAIEVLEHSTRGHFLTTNGLGHRRDGRDPHGTHRLSNLEHPFSQIGDYEFHGEQGHLETWRPFQTGDSNFLETPVTPPESEYNDTVKVFAYEDLDGDIGTTDDQWHRFVGGWKDGDRNNGFVAYIGGHKYATCMHSEEVYPTDYIHKWDLYFAGGNIGMFEVFTLRVEFNGGSEVAATVSKQSHNIVVGTELEFNFKLSQWEENKIKDIQVTNLTENSVSIDAVTLSWTNTPEDRKLLHFEDRTDDYWLVSAETESGVRVTTSGFIIEAENTVMTSGCTHNNDCSPDNIAGARLFLNTLFWLNYTTIQKEFFLSPPIVHNGILYQGSFQYPSYRGHLRAYDIEKGTQISAFLWDAAYRVPKPNDRIIYTHLTDSTSLFPFFSGNIELLRAPLGLTPENGDDSDEFELIEITRGKKRTAIGFRDKRNRLGGVVHSAPAIVEESELVGVERDTSLYLGTTDGTLLCINAEDGREKWAFIPSLVLDRLKNDRSDPDAIARYPSVDASPSVRDVYLKSSWKTVLVSAMGQGGNSIFAMDISDPDTPKLLWEVTDMEDGKQVMGHAYKVAIGKLLLDGELRYYIYAATNFPVGYSETGGILVYAYDLGTGEQVWRFASSYTNSVNDLPGAPTIVDIDQDGYGDRIFVGDMNGRLWELDALDGSNPNGNQFGKEIPLFNTGVANPISVSPSVLNTKYGTLVFFGTGGAAWTNDEATYRIYAINATHKSASPTYEQGAGTVFWNLSLEPGEKVWSSPIVSCGRLYVSTVSGTMESANPIDDIAAEGETGGSLYVMNFTDGSVLWRDEDIGKVRGSLHIDDEHLYLSTLEGQVVQIGSDTFDNEISSAVVRARPLTWHEVR